MSISAIARIVVSSRRCGNGIVMHCMIFSSLSLAWRVLRKKMEVVAATEASDFVVGSLFALAPCLGFYASTTTDLFSTKRTTNAEVSAGGNTAAAAVKTCVAVKSVVGMHVTYFSICGRSSTTNIIIEHTPHPVLPHSHIVPNV
jgi:hypothetical protein